LTSYATEGDLFSWVERADCAECVYERQAKNIVIQVAEAVRWLHELGIAHRDLSLENISVTKLEGNTLAKIIDFGAATTSRYCGVDESRGKLTYQAPEMHVGGYDAYVARNFAFGVIVFATMAQDFPWMSTEPGRCKYYCYLRQQGLKASLKARHSCKQPSCRLIEVLSPSCVDTMHGLLQADPSARMSLGETCGINQGRASFWQTVRAQEEALAPGVDTRAGSTRVCERELPLDASTQAI